MVTQQGRDDREANRRQTANLTAVMSAMDAMEDEGGNGEPPPVREEDKINPAEYH
eukprot:COSAG02_NODE_45441_length_357_cov_0.686047_1_plen_54_part_10